MVLTSVICNLPYEFEEPCAQSHHWSSRQLTRNDKSANAKSYVYFLNAVTAEDKIRVYTYIAIGKCVFRFFAQWR